MYDLNLIFGPPGTGKTTELLRLLEVELDKGVPVERIAYVSFTREGTYQGVRRAQEQFGLNEVQCRYFRTLHSLAYRQLHCTPTQVVGKKHYRELSNKLGMQFAGYYTADFKSSDDKYLFLDDLYRNNPSAAAMWVETYNMALLKFVRRGYAEYKKAKGLLDYTDMITEYVKQATPLDIDVAFVDEAQDLTTLQWKMVMVMVSKAKRVYIAGDDDQAIYQWSGADVGYFLSLRGNVTILRHSHRLPDKIRRFSCSISSQISQRVDKRFEGRGVEGEIYRVKSYLEIPIKPDESYMFLTRNNVYMEKIAEELRKRGIVFRLKGTMSVARQDVEAIKQYEEYRKTPYEISPYSRLGVAIKERFNIDDPWYKSFKWDGDKITYYRAILGAGTSVSTTNIDVSTIHSVKGAEADNVIVLPDMTQATMGNYKRNPDSEHRAFYVACTRAKSRLYLLEPMTDRHYKYYGEV